VRKMAVAIRTNREIELIRAAGSVVGRILQKLREVAKAGVSTAELAQVSDGMIAEAGGIALFKGVSMPSARFDYPASICASVNEEVVHGIPGERRLGDGDIISIDCGVKLGGYCGDAATTIMVGECSGQVQQLVRVTEEVLDIAVEQIRPGRYWSEIAARMQKHAEGAGLGVVREYVGHGIGRSMHEEPKLPNFVSRELLENDLLLRKGMVLAVEPMVNMGTWRVRVLADGWTVVTADGQPAAHFEHTIAVTDSGAEVLTAGS